MTPFDQWDYDGVNENILVGHAQRRRQAGQGAGAFRPQRLRLRARPHRRQSAARQQVRHRELGREGRPQDRSPRSRVPEHSPFKIGVNTQACPSAMGGKDQQPGSVDPKDPTKFYMPTNNWCMEDEPQARTHTQQGTVYVFANVYMYPEKPGNHGQAEEVRRAHPARPTGRSRTPIRTGAAR